MMNSGIDDDDESSSSVSKIVETPYFYVYPLPISQL